MSFLIDPPWLYANGRAYAALRPSSAQGRTAAPPAPRRWPCSGPSASRSTSTAAGRSRSGRRAAPRTGATGCSTPASCGSTTEQAGPATHAVSAALFATYPLWLWLGWHGGDERARFPDVAPRPLRVLLPARRRPASAPRGVWIRHTVLQRPGGAPTGSLWCTVFDADAGPPVAVKETLRRRRAGRLAGDRRAHASARPARSGSAEAQGRARELGADRCGRRSRRCATSRTALYNAPLPRTKLESPRRPRASPARSRPASARCELDGWPGMIGHNWGAQHAERWIWLHGVGFDGRAGRVARRRGRARPRSARSPRRGSPTARCSLDGAPHASAAGRAARRRAARGGDRRASAARRIHVTAPLEQTIAWVYADPPGGEHHSLNCSIAALEVRPAAARSRRRTAASTSSASASATTACASRPTPTR